jgi:hypothetical protein
VTHRADQVIDAIVALMPSTSTNFKHRVLSLSSEEGDTPARSVRMGEDEPVDEDGMDNFTFIDSRLTVEIDHKLEDPDEQTALERLLEMRRGTHVALMADDTLGLSFVIGTYYGGADAPQRDAEKSLVAGVITSRWFVHYRSNKADPA